MKHTLRLADYIDHMQQAAAQAIGFVERMDKAAFLGDPRTQSAVVYKLLVLGEAAGNVLSHHATFAAQHVDIPWRTIRATRNRVAHGYFDLNLDVVWDTVQTALPQLLTLLPKVQDAAKRPMAEGDPPTAAS
ncbi:HepT-like ribonuclease domain-containing protein [Variovorax sp. PvP013]|uniref:HepT-like ribonuclease domain-containing protein n=1 Tax=Variovorax sp. PvP013 TaxID=3156435 RepID=UPI003D1DBF53